MSREEIYGRIVDLASRVARGELDPLEVEISTLLERIEEVDIERLPVEVFRQDVEAIHGLALILAMQKDRIKASLEGLSLDALLVKTIILSLGVEELAGLLRAIHRPVADVSVMTEEYLAEALAYFRSVVRPGGLASGEPVEVEPEIFPEEDIRRDMEEMWRDLLEKYGEDWIAYGEVVRGDVYRAYLVSHLVTEGYMDMRMDRVAGEAYIRPLRRRRELRNPASLPVVVRRGG